MFDRAHKVLVMGGTFVANAESPTSPILQPLLDRVALNAILNAGGRADEVRCYPGTRNMVVGKLEKWMDGPSEPDHRIFWLSGPAGAGKSAIMQTVAERCKVRGTQAANFFFFRDDGTRNNAQPLIATLVYQLLEIYPTLHEHLKDCLTARPLAYKASTEEQFTQFISSPFKSIRNSSPIHLPIILIIDGLDECEDKKEQVKILGSLHALVEEDNSPFRLVVASRAEHHLQMSFNKIRTSVTSIFLDGTYGPDSDIRHFVIAKFSEIKQLHPLSHTLSKDWPADADIDAITTKSSGQFIYAATVLRFIEHSSGSPALSLRTILGMQPFVGNNPLAELNAVYSHVFSKAHDIRSIKLILCVHFILENSILRNRPTNFAHFLHLVGYEAMEIESHFADLVAIVQVTTAPHLALVFYHASLADYLKDKSQSGIYHVDLPEIAAELSMVSLKNFHNEQSFSSTIIVLEVVEKATTELSNSLLEASTRRLQQSADSDYIPFRRLAGTIDRLYFKRNRALFKLLLRNWIRFAYIHKISLGYTGLEDFIDGVFPRWCFRWYLATEGAKFSLKLLK